MTIVVGTRVNCGLRYFGEGIVYGVHGEQRPATVRTVAGFVASGGNATFDVVFHNGHLSRAVSEAIILGVQWDIREGVATAEEIADALAYSACQRAAAASAKDMAARRFAEEVERLQADPTHKKLSQGDDAHSGKLAAKNIRAALKVAFPSVKFSVTKRHHGSVDVRWTDGPTSAAVEAITGPYVSGSFDGMEDLYTSHVSPWNSVFGGAKYVFTNRDHSDAHTQRAIDALFETHGGLVGIEKPTPETLGRSYTPVPGETWELSTLVRIRAGEMEG